MIILDNSSSMGANQVTIGGVAMTRLDAAKASVTTLLDLYDSLGNVSVRFVTFSSGADIHGQVWDTVSAAKLWLANVTSADGTNYDAALDAAINAFSSTGSISGAQNVSYFLTDGLPTYGEGGITSLSPVPLVGRVGNGNNQDNQDDGIQPVEETIWRNFLNNNDIDSHAIAMGGPYHSSNSYDGLSHDSKYYLDPIAYDGTGAGSNADSIIVSNWDDLDATLTTTIPMPVCSGNFLHNNGWGVGADGGHMVGLSINNNNYNYNHVNGSLMASGGVYTYDNLTHVLVVHDGNHGVLTVNMENGDYSYTASPLLAGNSAYAEKIDISIMDKDGDFAAGSVTIDVARAMGDAGNNILVGTAGADVIIGAAGSDMMTGGAGSDVFRWSLGDAVGAPTDTIAGTISARLLKKSEWRAADFYPKSICPPVPGVKV